MPNWVKAWLAVTLGAAIVIGGFVWFLMQATSGLIEPIDRQIAALKAGDITAAYAETSQAFQQATSLDTFRTFIDANPILKDVTERSLPSRSYENSTGRVTGTFTSSNGAVLPVAYGMVWEQERWKILSIDLGS